MQTAARSGRRKRKGDNVTKTDKAVEWICAMAADNAHGYDQNGRWGPDYDCSSLVISAWEQAGTMVKSRGATYTGNMRPVFLRCGFEDVTGSVDLPSGAGLRRGDVLLNVTHHTAMYIGGGQLVHAAGNERGGAAGGRTGDQTGGEITARSYYNFPWDCVLRLREDGEEPEKDETEERGGVTYVVREGDTLWSIAEKLLGTGSAWPVIQSLNSLAGTAIFPGQVLRIMEPASRPPEAGAGPEAREECECVLPLLRRGDVSEAVAAAQTLLLLRGARLPLWGTDGEYGAETERAVESFRRECGSGGTVDASTWERLIKGA